MPTILSASRPEQHWRLALAAAFLLFCYVLLTWRASLLDAGAPLLSERRFLALLVGSGVFWIALRQLDRARRVTLARVASWIVGGTIVVLAARLAVDWWRPDARLTPSYGLRWSLAWGGYFGLWLTGALALRRPRPVPGAPGSADAAWVVAALRSELASASAQDRIEAADWLVAAAGQFERVEDGDPLAAAHNARLRLARDVAARLR